MSDYKQIKKEYNLESLRNEIKTESDYELNYQKELSKIYLLKLKKINHFYGFIDYLFHFSIPEDISEEYIMNKFDEYEKSIQRFFSLHKNLIQDISDEIGEKTEFFFKNINSFKNKSIQENLNILNGGNPQNVMELATKFFSTKPKVELEGGGEKKNMKGGGRKESSIEEIIKKIAKKSNKLEKPSRKGKSKNTLNKIEKLVSEVISRTFYSKIQPEQFSAVKTPLLNVLKKVKYMMTLPVNPDIIDEFLEKYIIDENSIKNKKKEYQIGSETKYYYLDPLTELPINLYKFKIIFCFDTNMFYTKDSFRKLFRDKYMKDEIKLTPRNARSIADTSSYPPNIDIDEYLSDIPKILSDINFTKDNFRTYIGKEINKFEIFSQMEKLRIWNRYINIFQEIQEEKAKQTEQAEQAEPVECMICLEDIEADEIRENNPNIINCKNKIPHRVHKKCLDDFYNFNKVVDKKCWVCIKEWKDYTPQENTRGDTDDEEFEEDEDDNLEMNLVAVGEVQPDNPLQFIHNYNLRGVITTIIFYILNSMTDAFVDKTSFFNLQIRLFLAFIVHIVIVSYIIQNRKELF